MATVSPPKVSGRRGGEANTFRRNQRPPVSRGSLREGPGPARPAPPPAHLRQVGAPSGREPGAGNREPGTGSREPGTGSREPGTGSREPGTGAMSAPAPPEGPAGPGSRSAEPRCPEHGLELRWFCGTERRLACSGCTGPGGRCRGHRGRPARERADQLRNKIVDQCEKLQLQSASITKYMADVLPGKKQSAASSASGAREVVIQRLTLLRSVCESEEQRLLEQVHVEEERAHQSILTQRAHWSEALKKLEALRTSLVGLLTHLDDLSLVQAEQEIFERSEEAEGILVPQESEKLNFNQKCVHSPVLSQLWASAVLFCLPGTEDVRVDEKTISPFLTLSEDRRTLTFNPKKTKVYPDGPERFDHWPNALASSSYQGGLHAWLVSVGQSCAYKVGVSSGLLPRKGSGNDTRLGHNAFSWVFSRYDKEFRFSHDGQHKPLELLHCPAQVGVLLDLAAGELLFYEPGSCAILHSHRVPLAGPLFPVFAVADQSISIVH
ncbi:B box and SPRY domain-containing protein [Tachyglossus aculeatus]|uniref:B box and SPRY domain-containing protein n=1 Tax=Tachyglossus aculeatus TaxID=9261 RepID=UPI0018F40312|nr:B box and SPRY domain-containing protein [Tachyglossus aculeatus]